MPASRRKGASAGAGVGKRLQTLGIFLTLVLVAVLVGSLAAGFAGRRGGGNDRASTDAGDAHPRPTERVRVEVLNASGISGLAAEGRRVLRDRGFDVVYIGNARGFGPDTSLVLDRVGTMETARMVADAIEVRRVVSRPDSNVYVDATVVLGTDWVPDTTAAPLP